QGEGASHEIRDAFDFVNTAWLQDRPDCIVLIRGGGSLEDLWTFNEEPVVRAVAASGLPVISGIGHEIDVSLCDLAADLRALTPTDAAMRLTQDDADLVRAIADLGRRLHRNIDLRMEQTSERLRRHAAHPLFTDTENRIILPRQNMLDRLAADCARGIDLRLERSRQSLGKTAAKLESLSPLSVLSRGYSLTQTQDGDIVHQADDVALGQTVVTRLAQGWLESSVTNKGKE
ncbi:MAG: exodeoxyribonuclease VII large subunit, partial [Planctomycetia bacterium]|nr:exodeoxyribonuclease VII large subunit [Planctomycetia bacterium]